MRAGAMIPGSLPPVSEIWELAQANLRELPDRYKELINAPAYPVEYSPSLKALRESVMRRHSNGGAGQPEAGTANGKPLQDEHA